MVKSIILKHLKLKHDTISIHCFTFIFTNKNYYKLEYFSDIALMQLVRICGILISVWRGSFLKIAMGKSL